MKKLIVPLVIFVAVLAAGVASIVLAGDHSGDRLAPVTMHFSPLGDAGAGNLTGSLPTGNSQDVGAGPQPAKSKPVNVFSQPASCPGPTQAVGITDFRFGPFPDGQNLVNWASALGSTGDYYNIWAGAPADAPQKGLLRVSYIFADSCRSSALGTPDPTNRDYVIDRGPLTITHVEGDVVFYDIAGGGTGSFDFVKGQFLR